MFEFNTHNPTIHYIEDSPIYIIDDFYKYPKEVEKEFWRNELNYHKESDPGDNGKLFHDMRHNFYSQELVKVTEYLLDMCGSSYYFSDSNCLSNVFKYEGVDYIDNYWYPHTDTGYTALIYFEGTGTNLYAVPNEIERDNIEKTFEHCNPWRPKNNYELLFTIESKYNRLVLFNGKQFWHGADISHSPTKRFNQALFFSDEPIEYI